MAHIDFPDVVIEVEVHIEDLLKLSRIFDDVGDVDESIFAFIDIDKSGLNIVEDVGDPSTIDVASKLTFFLSFDDQVVEKAVAQVGVAAFFRLDVE